MQLDFFGDGTTRNAKMCDIERCDLLELMTGSIYYAILLKILVCAQLEQPKSNNEVHNFVVSAQIFTLFEVCAVYRRK